VVPVQQWKIAPQIHRVAGLRRTAVAYAAGHGVGGDVLADLAIGVSAVLANIVRSSRHAGSSAPLSVSVDVADDRVLARVRGPQAQTARLDNPGGALGLVIAASLACDIRVCSSGSTGTEISMRFPRAATPRDPMPAAASVPHGRLSSAERESV
jgi:anti-sigma regulatory factor (Ser/Thr protein kinase)